MTHFHPRNGKKSITLIRKIISVWKGRSRVILSEGEFPSQNENFREMDLRLKLRGIFVLS